MTARAAVAAVDGSADPVASVSPILAEQIRRVVAAVPGITTGPLYRAVKGDETRKRLALLALAESGRVRRVRQGSRSRFYVAEDGAP